MRSKRQIKLLTLFNEFYLRRRLMSRIDLYVLTHYAITAVHSCDGHGGVANMPMRLSVIQMERCDLIVCQNIQVYCSLMHM